MIGRNSMLLALVPLCACAPKVSVQVLQPAMVTMPADVKTFAVVDRSKAKNAGETVLGALEGLVTGEGIGEDTEGRHKATESLIMVLDESPRFDAVVANVTDEQAQTGLFDDTLPWPAVTRICKKSNADALIALEAFDSDSSVSTSPPSAGSTSWSAERDTRVLTAWRVYYPEEKQIVDDVRDITRYRTWTGSGDTEKDALQNIPGQSATVLDLASVSGDAYGRRIAPNFIWVSRAYYGSGPDPKLKEGKNHVKAMDWDGARDIWRELVKSDDPKVRGRAEFDLALYNEVRGDLDRALEWAKKAAVDLHNGKSRNYAALLSQRIADQKLLQEQLRQEEEQKVKEAEQRSTSPSGGTTSPSGGTRPPSAGNGGGGTSPSGGTRP